MLGVQITQVLFSLCSRGVDGGESRRRFRDWEGEEDIPEGRKLIPYQSFAGASHPKHRTRALPSGTLSDYLPRTALLGICLRSTFFSVKPQQYPPQYSSPSPHIHRRRQLHRGGILRHSSLPNLPAEARRHAPLPHHHDSIIQLSALTLIAMSNLDQLVKGAPPPGTHYAPAPTTPIDSSPDTPSSGLTDPLASLPSSPPQIYLNLLILEASLRAQWLQLRTRRRQHTFFLTLLGLWVLAFGYALFLAPREDGSGVGGSVYWVVEVTERVCLMAGIVTGILVWGTGQWERGIRWPRRWVGTTNRGLRGFNCKLVVIKQSWWRECLSALSFFFSYGLFSSNNGSSYRHVDQALLLESDKASRSGGHPALPNIRENDGTVAYEEDIASGGDYIKLLLLPKPFSPNFRENWDIYRTEYWEKENERRAVLRKKIQERDRKIAKQQGGWLWWTGYRGWRQPKVHDIEKSHNSLHRHGHTNKDHKRARSGSVRSGSHSRNSSRSTTPSVEPEDGSAVGHVRRGSNASDHRKMKSVSGGRVQRLTPTGSRPSTPDVHSPLGRRNSGASVSSMDSERPSTPGGDGASVRSLRVSAKPGGSPARKSGRAAKQT
jgi:hypothetical protein